MRAVAAPPLERFFNRIEQCRRVATRYDRLAAKADPAGCSHLRQAARGRHPHLYRPAQHKPEAFKWTKSADQILASVKRFCHKARRLYVANFRFT
jgi:hypothetical protein